MKGYFSLIFFIYLSNTLHLIYGNSYANENDQQRYNLVNLVGSSVQRAAHSSDLNSYFGEENNTFLEIWNQFGDKSLKKLIIDYLRDVSNDKCFEDFVYLFQNLKSNNTWALKLFDAYGKFDSGFLQGNMKWLGEFNECTKTYAPPKKYTNVGDFHGKYCSLQLAIPVKNKTLPLSIGICLPDSCNPPETYYSDFFGDLIQNSSGRFAKFGGKIDAFINGTKVICQRPSKELTSGAIVTIFFISVFIFLAVVGTLITAYEKIIKTSTQTEIICNEESAKINGGIAYKSQEDVDDVLLIGTAKQNALPLWLQKINPFFNCFCFLTNGGKLLDTSSSEGQLPSLHGIRFLSMSWVIVCHTYAFSYASVRSPADLLYFVDNWSFQIILNGFFSVDSFFVLSGFLMAYLFFQQAAKTDGKVPWAYFYIHRYLRLTPVYMMVLAFFTTLLAYLGSGPLWMTYDTDPTCHKHWWWNLIYINNFQSSTEQCMGWAWYLANDMQFFVVSPLFLITLWRWPKIGYSVLGLFLCGTFLSNILITYHYGLMSGLGNMQTEMGNLEDFLLKWQLYFDKLYVRPYTRMSPYLVGIALAYILYKWKQNKYGKVRSVNLMVGWIISTALTLACLLGLYHQKLSLPVTALYNAFSRTCFACGLSWVMFVCINGQGGPVNSFLSFKLWAPLSRLTFCAYLVHPIVQVAYFGSLKALYSFSHITIIMYFFGFLALSYAAAFVTSLLFESPVIRLEKLIRAKFTQ